MTKTVGKVLSNLIEVRWEKICLEAWFPHYCILCNIRIDAPSTSKSRITTPSCHLFAPCAILFTHCTLVW